MQLIILPGIDGYSEGYEAFKQKFHNKVEQPFGVALNTKQSMVCLGQLLEEFEVEVITVDYSNDHELNEDDYIDLVLSKIDPDQGAFIMGYSFGGVLTNKIAALKLDYIKGYIFLASFLYCPVRLVKFISLNLLQRIAENDAVFEKVMKLYSPSDLSEDSFKEFVNYLKEYQLALMFKRLAIIKSTAPPDNILEVPALCLHSKADQLVGFKHADEFAKYYSDMQVREFNGDHMVFKRDEQGNYDEVRMDYLASEVFNFMLRTLFNDRNSQSEAC